jgi:hypothetical protein
VSAAQVFLHVALSAAQARLPAHEAGVPATHPPIPSHELVVNVLPVHVEPHEVVLLAYAHAGLVPLHVPLHALAGPASAPAQAGREPWGAPVTGEHVPGEPATSHASH